MFDRLAVLVWMDKTKGIETTTSRSWIPVNAHAPIKDGTVYSCMLTDKTNSKTQRVDVDFWKNGGKNLQVQTKPNTCGRGLRALA